MSNLKVKLSSVLSHRSKLIEAGSIGIVCGYITGEFEIPRAIVLFDKWLVPVPLAFIEVIV
jgi:hypothetical protein